MITPYERRLLLSYSRNVASRFDHRHPVASALTEWIEDHADLLEIGRSCTGLGSRSPDDSSLSCEAWERLKDVLGREVARARNARADSMAKRIRELARIVRMSKADIAILEFLLRYQTRPLVESMVDAILHPVLGRRIIRLTLGNRVLSDVIGLSYKTFSTRLSLDGPLVRTGLLSTDEDGEIEVVDRLKRLAFEASDSTRDVGQLLFGTASPSELLWSDFDHVADGRDHVERLIKGALKANAHGVNILVYGPPGTGKTQFCRTLATRLGVALHSIGESDGEGREPNRQERLQELTLLQHVFAASPNRILLFDEMEDLLASPTHMGRPHPLRGIRNRASSEGSKVYMNRMLERNAVPTLWTSNSAHRTCSTVLRRMMFALELRQPPRNVRARIWTRQLARHGIESDEAEADKLARDFEVSPGVAAGATAAAKLVDGGGIADVRRGVSSLSRLLTGEKPPQRTPAEFDPALVRSATDPAELADRFAGLGARRLSLCLSGPPGTGKSAFVRYLAERMGLEVEQKRASDLISMWVGGTEELIAAAFARAREDQHFLVFDEADSLLADRRLAHRSWEVSQVNEMLTWMESHPLPFACTTNFAERLDVATLRRFDFKIELGFLSVDQVRSAFSLFFGLEPPVELFGAATLTPGDFAVVRRRAEVLDCLEDPAALAEMLREECEAKPDHRQRIGFGG